MSDPADPGRPHAPRVGWVRRTLGRFHVTGAFWYGLAGLTPRLLPRWAFEPTEAVFSFFFYLSLHNIRRAIIANLEPVLGPGGFFRSQRRAMRTLWRFAQCFGDRYERCAFPGRFRVVIEGESHWTQALARGQGVILVTGHIGSWDMASQLAARGLARRVHVVREEEIDARSQAIVARFVREAGEGNCITHFATDDPRLGLELRAALGAGDIVALQADRPRGQSRVVEASLFRRPFSLPAGPAVLARLSGAPLLPVFCFRERHYLYRIAFRPALQVAGAGRAGLAVEEATRALGREIEWAIRERPDQWFALGPVWDAPAPPTGRAAPSHGPAATPLAS
jgi:KDO2-lipid IV(A) lauroyltransferase